jgi:hypothetical protein
MVIAGAGGHALEVLNELKLVNQPVSAFMMKLIFM